MIFWYVGISKIQIFLKYWCIRFLEFLVYYNYCTSDIGKFPTPQNSNISKFWHWSFEHTGIAIFWNLWSIGIIKIVTCLNFWHIKILTYQNFWHENTWQIGISDIRILMYWNFQHFEVLMYQKMWHFRIPICWIANVFGFWPIEVSDTLEFQMYWTFWYWNSDVF